VGEEPEAERKAETMIEDPLERRDNLRATLGVQFVERDEKVYVIFEAALGSKMIEVGVFEAGEADRPREDKG
jgi:hypothetical protein